MEIEFLFSSNPIPYEQSIEFMEARVAKILNNETKELVWFLEHPAIITAGTSAKEEDVLSNDIPILKANRGGRHTLHSLGQRVVYIMLNLKKRANGVPDPRKFVATLENVIINSLNKIGIKGEIRQDRVGVWVLRNDLIEDVLVETSLNERKYEEKIAAIGVRFKSGISMHGFAINFSNDLSLFSNIIPCGITEHGICSVQSLGKNVDLKTFDKILEEELKKNFLNYY